MTSTSDNSFELTANPFVTELIFTDSEKEAWDKERELVRQQSVAQYLLSPLYQARAAKDPDYWRTFSTGRVNLRINDAP